MLANSNRKQLLISILAIATLAMVFACEVDGKSPSNSTSEVVDEVSTPNPTREFTSHFSSLTGQYTWTCGFPYTGPGSYAFASAIYRSDDVRSTTVPSTFEEHQMFCESLRQEISKQVPPNLELSRYFDVYKSAMVDEVDHYEAWADLAWDIESIAMQADRCEHEWFFPWESRRVFEEAHEFANELLVGWPGCAGDVELLSQHGIDLVLLARLSEEAEHRSNVRSCAAIELGGEGFESLDASEPDPCGRP